MVSRGGNPHQSVSSLICLANLIVQIDICPLSRLTGDLGSSRIPAEQT